MTHVSSVLTPAQRQALIDQYLASSKGRDKLAESTYRPAELVLGGHGMDDETLDRLLDLMSRLLNQRMGGETFDHVRLSGLYADLRALRDRRRVS